MPRRAGADSGASTTFSLPHDPSSRARIDTPSRGTRPAQVWCLLYRRAAITRDYSSRMPQIRVVLAEDGDLLRAGVLALLEGFDDIDVVATATNLPELLAAVDEHRPDVLLTDIRMPPDFTDEGIRAAGELRRTHPGHRRRGADAVLRRGVRPRPGPRRQRRPRLPPQGAGGRRRRAGRGAAHGRGRRLGDRPDRRRRPDGDGHPAPRLAARPADAARAGGAGHGGARHDQRGDRGRARGHRPGGGEAHQLDPHQARPARRRAGAPPGRRHPGLPERGRRGRRRRRPRR